METTVTEDQGKKEKNVGDEPFQDITHVYMEMS
jgi:hypothetical protein